MANGETADVHIVTFTGRTETGWAKADSWRELYSRFLVGVSWNCVSAVCTQGTSLMTSIIVANALGKQLFGQYGILQSTILTIGSMAQVASGLTATKYTAQFRHTDKPKAGRILGLCSSVTLVTGLLACLAMILASRPIAAYALNAPALVNEVRVAGVAVLFFVANGYQTGMLAGLESYRSAAISSIIHAALAAPAIFYATRMWGLEGALLGLLASSLIRWAAFSVAGAVEGSRHEIRPRFSDMWRERTVLLRFAIPAAISGLTVMPAIWLANAFLVHHAGYKQMAIFSAALNLKSLVLFVPVLFNNVGISLINNQLGAREAGRFRALFWANLSVALLTSAGGAVVVAILARYLLRLYGRDFGDTYPVVLLLLGVAVLETAMNAVYQIIQAHGNMWLSYFGVTLPRDLVLVGLAFLLTGSSGAAGLAGAYAAAYALGLCLTIWMSRRIGLGAGGVKPAGIEPAPISPELVGVPQ